MMSVYNGIVAPGDLILSFQTFIFFKQKQKTQTTNEQGISDVSDNIPCE